MTRRPPPTNTVDACHKCYSKQPDLHLSAERGVVRTSFWPLSVGADERQFIASLDVVEAHPNLWPRHELQYLLQFLRGEPHRLANNFQMTDTNYYAVTNLLEERYGSEDMIRILLMDDLIQIRPPSQSVLDLRRFHDETYRVTTELQQLGDSVDANRLYEQTVMAKLPQPLKIELVRNSDYADKKTITFIFEGLRKYTKVFELTASLGIGAVWPVARAP